MAVPLTLGTAGHIDHGKTALVRALTGVETDRLPQERERGISIELGYAQLSLASGRRLSVIDVPGHERFVRTMVAGATGIDLYLMAIAADDGVMPQTREHAAVLRALAIDSGVVAVTKCDLADPRRALGEAAELLPGAEAVPVCARTGEGLEALRAVIERLSASLPGRVQAAGGPRLHVDRSFTVRGAGTVVTGTLWSGTIARGDELLLLPSGKRGRVRGVEVHDEPHELAQAGQRVAVNLSGVAVSEARRGDVLVSAGSEHKPTYRIDAQLDLGGAEPTRVQVHHGTRESPARVSWLGGSRWRLRLERPLIARAGDRLVIRRIAPPDTLGGGVVLDAGKHRPGAREPGGERARPGRSHEPGAPAHRPAPVSAEALSAEAVATGERLREARFQPPPDSSLDPDALKALRDAGRAVRVSRTQHFHVDVLMEVERRLIALASRDGGSVTIASLRDELATSRKYAQALLDHFDAERVTIRRGDVHRLRRSVAGGDVSARPVD